MFLPALLVRDNGVWAWVVFALPNVIGAAGMGWVLQRQGASEQLVSRHAAAMTAFSVVTILFHVLFLGWVLMWLGGQKWVLAAAGMGVVFYPLLRARRATLVLSAIVLAASLAAFVVAVLDVERAPVPSVTTTSDLFPLAIVCLLGFLLCPYLDLTFHRARQATGTYAAIASFTIGFGVFFLLMILFTLWYAPMVLPADAGGTGAAVVGMVGLAIAAHMAAQSGFTVAAHAVEIAKRIRARRRDGQWGALAGLLVGIGLLVATLVVRDRGGYLSQNGRILSGPELGYRLFMSFYALIAPAYVLAVLIPWPRSRSTEKQRWIGFAIALAVATPAFWFAFIEQQMYWALVGVAAVLLVRPILERTAAGRK
jgi:hypothetical protein